MLDQINSPPLSTYSGRSLTECGCSFPIRCCKSWRKWATLTYGLPSRPKEKIAVLENTVDLSEKRYETAKAAYEVGRSSKLEYLSAQVDLNADRAALIAQEEAYQNAKIELNRIMGVKVDYDFEVSDAITF